MATGSSGDAVRTDQGPGDPGRPTPTRMCIGCRSRGPMSELVRLVADATAPGGCAVDRERIRPGRGAHIHPRADCIEAAVKRRALPRALRSRSGASIDISQVRAQLLG